MDPSPQALLDLYRDTHYDVRLPGGSRATIRIARPLPWQINALLEQTSNGFLITACNPLSVELTTAENRQRMRALLRLVRSTTDPVLAGVGKIPAQPWREPLFLLTGTSIETIDDLARQFGQNAVVRLHANRLPVLRIYQSEWRAMVHHVTDIEWAPDRPAGLDTSLGR